MTRPAAIYARVSSDRQKENHTISSQLAALEEYAGSHGYLVPPEWRFRDEGYSGATLLRPGLEALRDLAAAGHLEVVLVHSPDRLSRKYAYQVLLAEELSRCGVELVFLKAPSGATPASGGLAAGSQPAGAVATGTATTAKESASSPMAGHSNPVQTGYHEPAAHSGIVASIGGSAINGTGMNRPGSGTGAIGGPAKIAGVINGTTFRPRHP